MALVALGPQLSSVTNDNQSSFLPSKYESVQAKNALDAAFPSATGQVATIVVGRSAPVRCPAAEQQKVSDLATTLTDDHIAGVAGVQAGQVAQTQSAQLMFAKLTADQGDQKAAATRSRPCARIWRAS